MEQKNTNFLKTELNNGEMSREPFVYLFSNMMGYFCFDVNRNQVIELSKKAFNDLGYCIKRKDPKLLFQSAELKRLASKGYLSGKHANKIENFLTEFIPDYLDGNLKNLVLQVTQNCNMRCRYCIYSGSGTLSRKHEKKIMNWEIAKQAIDFFAKHSYLSKRVEIGFYGGEPLLQFDLIKKCIAYCEDKFYNKEIMYSITTNGTIMTDEIIDLFSKYNVHVMVSVDGPKDIHDLNRRLASTGKGTFDIVNNNLLKIKERNKNFFESVIINSVCEPDQDNFIIEDFFLKNDLFKDLCVRINKVSDTYLDENYDMTKEYICEMETITFKSVLATLLKKQCKIRNITSNKFQNIGMNFVELGELPDKIHHGGGCMPGYLKTFVDIDGDIRPCEKVSEKSAHMIIGNVFNGFNVNKIHKLLNIGRITKQECLECWIVRHCNQCPAMIDDVDELSYNMKRNLCNLRITEIQEELHDYVYYKKMGLI